jgi:septal ring factor EnvC (AmiA/AmiB activator)
LIIDRDRGNMRLKKHDTALRAPVGHAVHAGEAVAEAGTSGASRKNRRIL